MSSTEGLVLTLERELPTPRSAVWRALTEPQALAQWWGPEGFTIPSIEYEPRAGRRYRIEMQPPEGDAFHLDGEFREVQPPERLAFTFVWDPPDPDDRETVALLELADHGDRTGVRLTQGEFATEERRALHEGGWTDSLDKLERLLS